jgi:hypothetical protein
MNTFSSKSTVKKQENKKKIQVFWDVMPCRLVNTGYTQKNGAVSIDIYIETAPFCYVYPVFAKECSGFIFQHNVQEDLNP